jgi:hypothetical protein
MKLSGRTERSIARLQRRLQPGWPPQARPKSTDESWERVPAGNGVEAPHQEPWFEASAADAVRQSLNMSMDLGRRECNLASPEIDSRIARGPQQIQARFPAAETDRFSSAVEGDLSCLRILMVQRRRVRSLLPHQRHNQGHGDPESGGGIARGGHAA